MPVEQTVRDYNYLFCLFGHPSNFKSSKSVCSGFFNLFLGMFSALKVLRGFHGFNEAEQWP